MKTSGKPDSPKTLEKYFEEDIKNQADKAMISDLEKSVDNLDIRHKFILSESDETDIDNNETEEIILGGTIAFWGGELAKDFGLDGAITQKEFNSLCRGQHPVTNEQLVRFVSSREIDKKKRKQEDQEEDQKTNQTPKTFFTKTRRAGLNSSLSAPKSVSAVAMLDKRVIQIHILASISAMKVDEQFIHAKMGNVNPPQSTSKAIFAAFVHFESRPDKIVGVTTPNLHTHLCNFNLTQTKVGKFRAIEYKEVFRTQRLMTAAYRSVLIKGMQDIGYEMRIDRETGAPEVVGISREYIDAISLRQNEIKKKAEELGIKSTRNISKNHRRSKDPDKTKMLEFFYANERKFSYQATKAVDLAKGRSVNLQQEYLSTSTGKDNPIDSSAKDVSKSKLVVDAFDRIIQEARDNQKLDKDRRFITKQSLMADTLNYSLDGLDIEIVQQEIDKRDEAGELDEFELDRYGSKKVQITSTMQKKSKSEKESTILKLVNIAPPQLNQATNDDNEINENFTTAEELFNQTPEISKSPPIEFDTPQTDKIEIDEALAIDPDFKSKAKVIKDKPFSDYFHQIKIENDNDGQIKINFAANEFLRKSYKIALMKMLKHLMEFLTHAKKPKYS